MTSYTRIPVQYRCGANYKDTGHLVLQGVLTAEDVEHIRSLLDDGNRYVPDQLGMDGIPALAGLHLDPQWDSRWQEIYLDDREVFEYEPRYGDTDEYAGTVGEFAAAVEVAARDGWCGELDEDEDG